MQIIKDSQHDTEWPEFVESVLADNRGKKGNEKSTWIFQGNLKYFDIERALKTLKTLTWVVNQHKDEIKSGDTAYIWQSGPNAGIVAASEILNQPKTMPMEELEKPFIKLPEWFKEEALRVPIRIDRVLKEPLLKETLIKHPTLSAISILKAPQGSNFALTAEQAASLKELITPVDPYSRTDALQDLFIDEDEFDYILSRLKIKKNIIIQGPPGVGKTFIARRIAYTVMGFKDDSRAPMIQFHQSYSYEDFIQGFRPNAEGKFDLKDGVFYEFCKNAQKNVDKSYFFIIDEINRGNLSKIFGELLMLIEPDKRGPDFAVPLTYSKGIDDKFYLPDNLHIIGTMNTADRSLAMVDYALRRRFSFIYLEPKFTNPKFSEYLIKKFNVEDELVDKIIDRMTKLNEVIAGDTKNLGTGYQIGHSYFCPDASGIPYDEGWYHSVIKSDIAPLLSEYWFDDSQKVQSLIESLLS